MKRVFVWTCVAALAAVGCSKDKKNEGAAPTAAAPIAPPAAGQAPVGHAGASAPSMGGAAAAPGSATGKVVETMNAGGYTYVNVDTGAAKMWAAGPQVEVKVGDSVSFSGGSPMEKYYSKTLDRSFDVVYFVPAIYVGDQAAAAAAAGSPHGGMGGGMGGGMPGGDMAGHGGNMAGHGGDAAAAPAAVKVDGIEKVAGGQTVAEVFAGKAALAGKSIKVRGKVVKYNGGIMGKNWLHLQDGSGAAGSNDLTVTTSAEATVGDTVVVTGVVSVDKDFGAGYKYDLIVEDATISK